MPTAFAFHRTRLAYMFSRAIAFSSAETKFVHAIHFITADTSIADTTSWRDLLGKERYSYGEAIFTIDLHSIIRCHGGDLKCSIIITWLAIEHNGATALKSDAFPIENSPQP